MEQLDSQKSVVMDPSGTRQIQSTPHHSYCSKISKKQEAHLTYYQEHHINLVFLTMT